LNSKFPNVFYLRATDPATASIALEARFEVKDRSELRLLLDMPDDELLGHAIYDLEPFLVAKIANAYGLSFEPVSRVNQGGKRDNQDGKFFEGVISEAFSSDLTRLEAI
jgi:hypothetical protein